MTSDGPITSHQSRAEWLAGELSVRLASPGAISVSFQDAVAWYMQYGHSLGVCRQALEHALVKIPEALEVARRLTPAEIEAGRPPPELVIGQAVEVIVNARNITYHRGSIRDMGWHHKEGKWLYLLREGGKNVAKRYEARDLRAIEG